MGQGCGKGSYKGSWYSIYQGTGRQGWGESRSKKVLSQNEEKGLQYLFLFDALSRDA